jgi:hypothetical protein
MTTVRVYVQTKGYDLPESATALDAVQAADAAEAADVRAGTRLITDSRGLVVSPESVVYAGVIYRLISRRDRDVEAEL